MSEENLPRQDGAQARPKRLLQQMEELMAALNADLSALDADLQSAGDPERPGPRELPEATESAASTGRPGRPADGAGHTD
ncbi:hypothetical protein [Streptomyces sp. H72]